MGAGPRALRRFGKGRSGGALVPAANESGDAPGYRLSPHSTKEGCSSGAMISCSNRCAHFPKSNMRYVASVLRAFLPAFAIRFI